MKRNLAILAALTAAAATAEAQSQVTVFGVVDAAVSRYAHRSTDLRNPAFPGSLTVRRTALTHSGYNASRLGFRGVEDLGGGLKAGFWLEAPITNDDGATGIASFARRATVSLSGRFGEVRLGRDYTPTVWNDTVFDPFGIFGVGTSLIFSAGGFNIAGGGGGFGGNPNFVRASNAVGYFLPPTLGGFHGQVMYAFHERSSYRPGSATPPGPTRAGRYVGGRFGYAKGPLSAAFAHGVSNAADDFYAGTADRVKTTNLGASYDFGAIKLFGELSRIEDQRDHAAIPSIGGTRRDVVLSGFLVGMSAPVGAGLIRASYSRVRYAFEASPLTAAGPDPRAAKLALGYVHNLSKRTALYATVAQVRNRHGAALTVGGPAFGTHPALIARTSTGYDLGIRHAF